MMNIIVKDLVIVSVVLLLLDFVFLTANKKMFESQVIQVQRTALQMKPLGAVACYIFLIFGLYYFIIRQHCSILEAFLLGIVIYGVYETTTYALLKNWSINTVMLDTVWGGVLFALTTAITYRLSKMIA